MKLQSTYSLHYYITGLQYYVVLEVWKQLEMGKEVQSLPEPNNHYDEYAVAVAFDGKKLGYLPRSQKKKQYRNFSKPDTMCTKQGIRSLYTQNPIRAD